MFATYLIACLILALIGPDRRVWLILSASAVTDETLGVLLLDHIDSLDLPVFAGLFECATIWALLTFARGRAAGEQAACLVACWLCHFTLLVDLTAGTSLIYDRYESLVFTILGVQVLLGVNGSLVSMARFFHSRLVSQRAYMASCRLMETQKKPR